MEESNEAAETTTTTAAAAASTLKREVNYPHIRTSIDFVREEWINHPKKEKLRRVNLVEVDFTSFPNLTEQFNLKVKVL